MYGNNYYYYVLFPSGSAMNTDPGHGQCAHLHTGHRDTQFWNDGAPDYEKIQQKGIGENAAK